MRNRLLNAVELTMDTMRYRLRSNGFRRIGTKYGGWWVETRRLSTRSSVVSAGVGEDISFDIGLINSIGCRVISLDPTPKAVHHASIACSDLRFEFQPYALAKDDGYIALIPPDNPIFASWALGGSHRGEATAFAAKSLRTIMNENAWERLDLVKMDIEGSEYEVIEGIVENNIPISQLCVEFHDEIASKLNKKTKEAIANLESHGLHLAFKEHRNYTFMSSSGEKEQPPRKRWIFTEPLLTRPTDQPAHDSRS